MAAFIRAGKQIEKEYLPHYYDLRHGRYEADIPFYQELLRDVAPTLVLELGCGTARLLPSLRRLAPAVVGIEASAEMLVLARQRLLKYKMLQQVLLVRGDIRHCPVQGAALAIMAMNTFCHFISLEEQKAALKAAVNSLRNGGVLALDLPNPHNELAESDTGNAILEAVYPDAEETVYEWTVTETDAAAQELSIRTIYDVCAADGLLRRHESLAKLRLFYRYEMELLLQSCDFHVENVLGDYDYSEYTDTSPRMLILARKV